MASLKQLEYDSEFNSLNTKNWIFDFKIMQYFTKKNQCVSI